MNRLPVLFVDDSDINLAVAEVQCNELGIDCVLRDSGDAAISIIAEQGFSAIVTDIGMPGMDGIELCKAVRSDANSEIAGLPIIAVTTNITDDYRQLLLASGFNDALERPLEIEVLAQLLESWCGGKQVRSSASGLQGAPDCPIDLQLLSSLIGTDDPSSTREWLQLFLRLFPETLSDVSAAVLDRNSAELKKSAHKGKGSARSTAASRLSTLMAELESSDESPDWQAIEKTLDDAKTALEEIEDYLEDL
ncbi:MAG: response regulator [Gammaproteobacteria bacterium]|jgi:CheY-like chemotaxis protein/HPt (histidine-containing phosphotransfer) domain-containing protein|nr:response regulator [Gammaproteobacteria bacterium]MBT4492475.1 response regulator [Gammaproteobacteria bacterium]